MWRRRAIGSVWQLVYVDGVPVPVQWSSIPHDRWFHLHLAAFTLEPLLYDFYFMGHLERNLGNRVVRALTCTRSRCRVRPSRLLGETQGAGCAHNALLGDPECRALGHRRLQQGPTLTPRLFISLDSGYVFRIVAAFCG